MIMAVAGQVMVLFLIIHIIGNSTIYFNWLNAYAHTLHSLPVLVWGYRIIMAFVVLVHMLFGIILTLENLTAGSGKYAVKRSLKKTLASETMIWSGLMISAFLLYHLLHFTVQVVNPGISARLHADALGRPDVMKMVVSSFRGIGPTLLYSVGLVALLLHLQHGIQSSFQTLGLNNERTMPVVRRAGSVTAYLLFLAYISIPIVIVLGILNV